MTELKRIIKAGFINFKRGGSVSFAAVLQVVNTLAVIVTIILLQAVLYSSLGAIKDKVDVTIYFNVGASENQIMLLKNSLLKGYNCYSVGDAQVTVCEETRNKISIGPVAQMDRATAF